MRHTGSGSLHKPAMVEDLVTAQAQETNAQNLGFGPAPEVGYLILIHSRARMNLLQTEISNNIRLMTPKKQKIIF